jgi:hypothetical protein
MGSSTRTVCAGSPDGIVIQLLPQGDDMGWDEDNEQPDRVEAEQGVRTLQELYSRMDMNGHQVDG